MARVSKTICDACGFEELDSKGGYPDISRVFIKVGWPQEETRMVNQARDLCSDCQDRIKNAVLRALEPIAREKK